MTRGNKAKKAQPQGKPPGTPHRRPTSFDDDSMVDGANSTPATSPQSDRDSPPADSDPETQLQYSVDSILIGKFKRLLQRELNAVAAKITDHVTQELRDLGQRTAAIEDKVDDLVNKTAEHEIQLAQLKRQLTDMQDNVEDQENRSRRNNIRIRGIPEAIQNLQEEVPLLLKSIVPDISDSLLLMDRVHRALGPRREGAPPKDIIARLHYYSTKEAIMSASRAAPHLEYKGHQYSIYADLAALTIQKRKLMKPALTILTSHRIRYRWGYPFKLTFMYQNRPYSATTLPEGLELLTRLKLQQPTPTTPNTTPRKGSSERSISPLWRKSPMQQRAPKH
eukprot:XP_017946521.1 PREDICTED: UDP-Gal:betaGlcNAc beta 1,4- galactosyltransferase, polypeptide 1, gene 1 isoform X3 [Xenopus tropicalis]